MSEKFKLLMLSAMYENGGNTTHRFLDGHPEMYVYPFESQIGTKLVSDMLSKTFPTKYRWPVFDMDGTVEGDYHAIIDEECKVRARTPKVSKFRQRPFDFSDDERAAFYLDYVKETGRSAANNVSAFFKATFKAWKDYQRSGNESVYVGYSPVFIVDAPKMLAAIPDSCILHVVRNPWSAYAETKKRPVPLDINSYLLGWTLNQYYALLYAKLYPNRVFIVRYEDVIANPLDTLGDKLELVGVKKNESLKAPTWNSSPMETVYPWGTIRTPTPEMNLETANQLSTEEKDAVAAMAWQYIDVFDYARP